MENIVLAITIGERDKSENYMSYFKEQNIELSLGTFGRGTANKEMLDTLGIGSSDKFLIFSFMTMEKSKYILQELEKRLQMRKVGVGISFTIPLSSIDSLKSLKRIVKDVDVNQEGDGYVVETENELIIIVANRGYTEPVMEVAREAGAAGGTVVHARGTGHESSEKFFGTIIGAEKEMIFIVSKAEKVKKIMTSIKEKVGQDTPSGAVCFSIPVNDTAGLLES